MLQYPLFNLIDVFYFSNQFKERLISHLLDFSVAEITVKKMLSETNRYRLMHDATPLGYCPVCADAAQKHVDDIASSGVVKPDGKAKYGQIIFSTSDANDIKNGNYFGTLVPAKM